jgi:hypothetical protein
VADTLPQRHNGERFIRPWGMTLDRCLVQDTQLACKPELEIKSVTPSVAD